MSINKGVERPEAAEGERRPRARTTGRDRGDIIRDAAGSEEMERRMSVVRLKLTIKRVRYAQRTRKSGAVDRWSIIILRTRVDEMQTNRIDEMRAVS